MSVTRCQLRTCISWELTSNETSSVTLTLVVEPEAEIAPLKRSESGDPAAFVMYPAVVILTDEADWLVRVTV